MGWSVGWSVGWGDGIVLRTWFGVRCGLGYAGLELDEMGGLVVEGGNGMG